MLSPRKTEAAKLARTLRDISHPLRLRIICMLSSGEKPAGEICGKLGTSRGNISQHLRKLVDNGALDRRRKGSWIFYGIRDRRMCEMVEIMRRLYCPGEIPAGSRP